MPLNQTKVGIVIPNHNYEKWVKNAIISAASDPYENKTIAVVDDGSTDNSWPIICKTLGLKNIRNNKVLEGSINDVPVLAYRYNEAGGPSRARNTGVKILWEKADLYGFLDSDDEYYPGKISKSVKKFMLDPIHVGAIYSDYDTINEDEIIFTEYKEPFSRARLVQECIVNNNSFINKRVFENGIFYDEEMRTCEDYDLWMRISESFCLIHIPETLVKIRVGKHNSTSTVSKEIWNKNWQRVQMKAQARLHAR